LKPATTNGPVGLALRCVESLRSEERDAKAQRGGRSVESGGFGMGRMA
jgi:hypothetical protein